MSEIPEDLTYTTEHEYLKKTSEESIYQLGITDFAQGELGDVVFVELPEAGTSLRPMESFGTIEAVKAVSDLYCPVNCEVVDVNAALMDDPSLVNSDPYGEGWMIRVRVADEGALSGLLDRAGYAAHIGEG